MKTNCIVCDIDVDNWDDAYPENSAVVHPIGGTVFRAYGNYGSTVFDPMDASFLEVVICDSCLGKRSEYAYRGVDEKFRNQIETHRAEMDNIIAELSLRNIDG